MQIPAEFTYLLSNLLIQAEAGQYRQREDHHSQAVVSQKVDQCAIKLLHVVLQNNTTSFTHTGHQQQMHVAQKNLIVQKQSILY